VERGTSWVEREVREEEVLLKFYDPTSDIG